MESSNWVVLCWACDAADGDLGGAICPTSASGVALAVVVAGGVDAAGAAGAGAGGFFAVAELAGCLLPIVCLGLDGDGFSGAVVASGGVVAEVLGSVGGIVTGGVCVCCSG